MYAVYGAIRSYYNTAESHIATIVITLHAVNNAFPSYYVTIRLIAIKITLNIVDDATCSFYVVTVALYARVDMIIQAVDIAFPS